MKVLSRSKDTALFVAGVIFAFIALVHLLRLLFNFNLLVARHIVPMWVSIPGFIIFFALAIWMFVARSSKGKRIS